MMSAYQGHLLGIYRFLLRLYPTRFREAYAEEMLLVFEMHLKNHLELRLWSALHILGKELIHLPALLAAAHFRERIKPMSTKLERWFCQPEGSWTELLLAVLPFFLMGIIPGIFSLVPAIRNLPLMVGLPILLFLTLILVLVGIIGLIVRLPRWTLVYVGILLTIFSLGSIFLIYQIFPPIPLTTRWSTFLNSAVLLSLHLVLLFLLVGIVVWITRKIPRTRKFSHELSRDPINISFMLFGGAFLLILAGCEDVPGGNLYLILSSLMMGMGAWGFLHLEKPAYQLALLLSSTSAAAVFATVANLTLVEYPSRSARFLGLLIPMPALFGGLSYLIAMAMITFPLLIFKPSGRIMTAEKTLS